MKRRDEPRAAPEDLLWEPVGRGTGGQAVQRSRQEAVVPVDGRVEVSEITKLRCTEGSWLDMGVRSLGWAIGVPTAWGERERPTGGFGAARRTAGELLPRSRAALPVQRWGRP